MVTLTERLATLSDTMRASQQLMLRIAEAQPALAPALQRLREHPSAATTWRARICATSNCICNDCSPSPSRGAQSTLAELRSDIRILTRTVAALAEERN